MCKEYIDRDAAITAIGKPIVTPGGAIFDALKKACQEEVRSIPAADVRPVVRGKWIESKSMMEVVYCSECGFRTIYGAMPDGFGRNYNYCPICGAMMEES